MQINGIKDIKNNLNNIGSYSLYIYSCRYGYIDGIKKAKEKNIYLNCYNNVGLKTAIYHNQLEVIKYLIPKIGINAISDDFIQIAYANEYIDILVYFINDCNIDIEKIKDLTIKNLVKDKIIIKKRKEKLNKICKYKI